LRPDASQKRAVDQLALLQAAVVDRSRARRRRREQEQQPDVQQPPPSAHPPPSTPACLGAYLWGDVGTGKTALADLFLATLPADVPRRRAHFHAFMLAFHRRQHELLSSLPKVSAPTRQGGGSMRVWRTALPVEDPILTAAREIALGGGGGGGGADDASSSTSSSSTSPPSPPSPLAVLCLDELHVTDVADAMILNRFFSALTLDHGVSVLFTSNRPPGELYEGGLSRKFFLPFVRLCESRLLGLRLGNEAGADYRRRRQLGGAGEGAGEGATAGTGGGGAMFVGPGAREALERAWEQETTRQKGIEQARDVVVPVPAAGRGLVVPRALLLRPPSGSLAAAFFTFEELCGSAAALSSADYCALIAALADGGGGALFVSGVPATLDPRKQRDEARRLVTSLDVACDALAAATAAAQEDGGGAPAPRLVLALEGGGDGGPDSLFEALARERAERAAAAGQGGDDEGDDCGDDLPASLYAEEALMYRRAASRLAGMCEVVVCDEG
jgi:cell division protein ZapE